jgi:hypothetical protein
VNVGRTGIRAEEPGEDADRDNSDEDEDCFHGRMVPCRDYQRKWSYYSFSL